MMKKILIILLFFTSLAVNAQTNGISYQAVIVGPDNQELPGVDAQGNILPDTMISIRFTIIDANNATEYQEVQTTNTDQYGRINLLIGEVNPDAFAEISWDGTSKDLKVEIDFDGGSDFADMSREKLTFLPYAYHRNITASGTLTVDDATFLNGELAVQGPTQINSTLNVNSGNASNLSGDLSVEGVSNLNNNLKVAGSTRLSDSLTVINQAPTNLTGDLRVEGEASFNGDLATDNLVVNNTSDLRGQVTISANMDNVGLDSLYTMYPLQIEGSSQGIAIKVNGSRTIANNYVSFWDDNQMWGRIEGISDSDLENSADYIEGLKTKNWDIASESYNTAKATWELGLAISEIVAASTSSTVCVGVGACVTTPIPSLIIVASISAVLKTADLVLAGINLGKSIVERVNYHDNRFANIGVTYASGSGDYAEWLIKDNPQDIFIAGEIVGVKNGMVTKNPWVADKVMIVSTKPIVLGNMPQPNEEQNSVKIAFMGQVPVQVLGKVSPGDYILPNILANGFARAVNPSDMQTKDFKKIAGVAWNIIKEISNGVSIVNVAVGTNTNDLSNVVNKQEEEIKSLRAITSQLQSQIKNTNNILSDLVPGYAEALSNDSTSVSKEKVATKEVAKDDILYQKEDDIIYFEISREQIETAIGLAREEYIKMLNESKALGKLSVGKNDTLANQMKDAHLVPIEDHPFWKRIDSDPVYRAAIIDFIQSQLKKEMHTHKKYASKFTDLKVNED